MTEKELRRMGRKDLLRLLIEGGEERERIRKEIEQKTREMDSMIEKNEKKDDEFRKLMDDMSKLASALNDREKEICQTNQMMKNALMENGTQIERLMKKLDEKEVQIRKLGDLLEQKDKQNRELANKLIERIAI